MDDYKIKLLSHKDYSKKVLELGSSIEYLEIRFKEDKTIIGAKDPSTQLIYLTIGSIERHLNG